MCGNSKCKFINLFYLVNEEKVMIHYDAKHNPIWIQHYKDDKENTFIPDKYNLYEATEVYEENYKPKIKILNKIDVSLCDY